MKLETRNSKLETRNAERGRLTVDGLAFHSARWLMLAALVFAPWAYGGIPDWAAETLNGMMAGVLLLWIFGCLLRQSLPSVPRMLVGATVALVTYAWFVALNAKSDFHESSREWIKLAPWFSWLPGSIDQSASFSMARRVSALLLAVCFVCDMARRTIWRERLLRTVALNGAAFVLFGLVQRLADAPAVYWGDEDFGLSFFATYRYHSNAGAFINLVWPLVAGFAVFTFLRGKSWKLRLGWGTALIICLAGVLVNASRAAGVLALLLGAAWIGWLVWQAWRGRIRGVPLSVAAMAGGLLLLLIIAIGVTAGLDTTARRWGRFAHELTATNPRLQVVRVCLEMIPESGWIGFGPGSWRASFPYFSPVIGAQAGGVWEHAHNDYLETIIDWGFLGAAGWGGVIFGGLAWAGVRFWKRRAELGDAERVTYFAVLSAMLGMLLHSLVDFPLQIASLQLCFAALLGVMWAAPHWLREAEHPRPRRSRPNPMPVAETARSF